MRKINTRSFRVATRSTPREVNRQIVHNLIREHQPISRAELARRMNVRRAALTNIVRDLLTAGDIEETVKRVARPGTTAALVGPATTLRNEVAVPPREAFLGEAEQLAVDDAVGRISCEAIASYPPGVPALLPGERISAETVSYLRELAEGGARLHGASDPRFQTINVLREER